MGTDYAQRKLAKKKWKKFSSETSGDADKKKRSKRQKIRRLCQGMCYGEPELKSEDTVWEKESDGYDPEIEKLKYAKDGDDTKREAQGMRQTASQEGIIEGQKKPRLSTSVELPTLTRDEGPDARHARKRQKFAEPSTALSAYPLEMQRYMQAEGYMEPTDIQERCWPACLQGRDVRAIAEPGSGKTLGYLLPALPWLKKRIGTNDDAFSSGPGVLILVPTRELAQQVAACCRNLQGLFNLRTACIFGGGNRSSQEEAIRHQPHVVVATPGRLLDLIDASSISLGSVGYLVLDEADKMLSLGLRPQLDRIRDLVFPEQQTKGASAKMLRPQVLLFTATMPAVVEETAEQWQYKPVVLQVNSLGASISHTVVQVVQVCAEHKKPKKLLKHLGQIKDATKGVRNPPRILIFVNRVKTVRFLHSTISSAGFKVAMLHGERTQAEREEALFDFRSGKVQVLVATDVAARGLHIRGLPYIVNYDFPTRLEPYVHRVGRTGRLASSGHAFSFFTRNLAPLAQPLLALLQEHGQAVDPNLVRLAEAYSTAMAKVGNAAAEVQAEAGVGAASESSDEHINTARGGCYSKCSEEPDEDDEDGRRQSAGAKAGHESKAIVPASALPGLYKIHKAAFDPDLKGFSDEELQPDVQKRSLSIERTSQRPALRSDGAKSKSGTGKLPIIKLKTGSARQDGHRALPGRLRKKLAKEMAI